MSDEDLIRRGDVLAEIELYRSDWSTARDEIAAIPSVQVGVKPDCGHPWCGDKCGTEVSTPQPSPDVAALVKAADAVVDRWKQPTWKDAGPTGQFIGELETAIAAFKDATK